MTRSKGFLSLTPLLVFLVVYVISSLISGDFYAVPVSSSFFLACVWAVVIADGGIKQRLATFSEGAGNPDILMMIWIFLLAGIFAQTAKGIGAVEVTTNLLLSLIPSKAILAGLFVTACLISMSVGTSVGTLVSLVPIGAGIAGQTGMNVALVASAIVGGAFFGDNLSFISDTTIAATRSVGCEMKDKFKANLSIVLPAFIIVCIIYALIGNGVTDYTPSMPDEEFRILPYLLVIVLSLLGSNVSITLCAGIACNAIIGFATGDINWTGWLSQAGKGISGMSDLVIVTLLSGGLLGMIKRGGGIDAIISALTRGIRNRKGAEASIAAIVSLANICTANNTIAIITSGGIAKEIAGRFGIEAKRAASILDTFSCFIQGMLPYGAQLLLASSLCETSPTAIIPYLYYPFMTGVCAVGYIVLEKGAKKAGV